MIRRKVLVGIYTVTGAFKYPLEFRKNYTFELKWEGMAEQQKLPTKFTKYLFYFFRAENNALICSMFYAIQRESLTLPYTPLEREFKALFNHI